MGASQSKEESERVAFRHPGGEGEAGPGGRRLASCARACGEGAPIAPLPSPPPEAPAPASPPTRLPACPGLCSRRLPSAGNSSNSSSSSRSPKSTGCFFSDIIGLGLAPACRSRTFPFSALLLRQEMTAAAESAGPKKKGRMRLKAARRRQSSRAEAARFP